MQARSTSGSYTFQPPIADLVLECFERIGIYSTDLTDPRYAISARRSANLILSDYPNRGINLWTVGDEPLAIPLLPGVKEYAAPRNTVELLDSWRRTYTPSTAVLVIGQPITAMMMAGKVATTSAGEPMLVGAGSGTLSSVQGDQRVTLHWPAHGLSPGQPIFWQMPVSIGLLIIQGFSIVETVVDQDHVTFLASDVAPLTSTGMGATPLYAARDKVPLVACILPGHGQSIGSTWTVNVETSVGGITIPAGQYTVEFVNGTSFFFNPTSTATVFITNPATDQILVDQNGDPMVVQNLAGVANAAAFENMGMLGVSKQQSGVQPQDIYLYPLSRSEYAMLPEKDSVGQPTQLWFNRTIVPSVTMWPVPPAGSYYGLISYRMRALQDANPENGEALDVPARAYLAFVAELTAALAEKWRPERFAEKAALAIAAWERFTEADTERVSTYILPQFQGYFGNA